MPDDIFDRWIGSPKGTGDRKETSKLRVGKPLPAVCLVLGIMHDLCLRDLLPTDRRDPGTVLALLKTSPALQLDTDGIWVEPGDVFPMADSCMPRCKVKGYELADGTGLTDEDMGTGAYLFPRPLKKGFHAASGAGRKMDDDKAQALQRAPTCCRDHGNRLAVFRQQQMPLFVDGVLRRCDFLRAGDNGILPRRRKATPQALQGIGFLNDLRRRRLRLFVTLGSQRFRRAC